MIKAYSKIKLYIDKNLYIYINYSMQHCSDIWGIESPAISVQTLPSSFQQLVFVWDIILSGKDNI